MDPEARIGNLLEASAGIRVWTINHHDHLNPLLRLSERAVRCPDHQIGAVSGGDDDADAEIRHDLTLAHARATAQYIAGYPTYKSNGMLATVPATVTFVASAAV
ncbi:hypothetical protein GCM10010842_32220 [Deinococcus daejeonensis]|uniref:Uncharacterized protein n=1 Tax=Deinococcus daejeonensis TaxID=1007098 RepID=A0ABQ2JC87_9DEIO|nr:hypothetical protein GCM10010842_32220 [Deinococcus daejeonensis]